MSNKFYKVAVFTMLILTTLLSVYLTNRRNLSYKTQVLINSDINAKDWTRRDFNFINSIDVDYPTLNVFSMPMKSIKAEYLVAKDSVLDAIKLHEQAALDNPYLMFSESRLASIYQNIGWNEEFEYYARRAYKGLPNNALHYVMMTRLLMNQGKLDSIFANFESIDYEVKIREPQVWVISLAAIVYDSTLIRKYDGKKIAKEALNRFSKNDQVRIMHDYIIYGKENVDLASSYEKEGIKMFQEGNQIQGINKIKNAIELHPNIRQYYDNYIIANYDMQNYSSVSNISSEYIQKFNDTSSSILFMIAHSTYISNEKERDNACQILKDLDSNNLYVFDKMDFELCF